MPHIYEDHIKPECKDLEAAIKSGDLEKVKTLVSDQNLDTPIDSKFENTPLMVALLHQKLEVAEFLIEKKCDVNKGYKNAESQLVTPLYHNTWHGTYAHKIGALLLIKSGADIHDDKSVCLSKLGPKHPLSTLIENLRKYKNATDEEKSALENSIGLDFANLDDSEEATKWYQKAIQKNNPVAMWNLHLILTKQKKYDQALALLEKSYPLFKEESDKKDIIEKLKIIAKLETESKESTPKTVFDAHIALVAIYMERNDSIAFAYIYAANILLKKFRFEIDPNLQKMLEWTDLSTLVLMNMSDQTRDASWLTTHIINLARTLKKENAIEFKLLSHYLKETLGMKAIAAYASKHFTPSELKLDQSAAEAVLAENKDYIEGLTALYGWNRKKKSFRSYQEI